jgi:transcription antitermination protein NusB
VRARRTARRLALDVLYEAEIRDRLPLEALEAREKEGWVIPGAGEAAADAPEHALEQSPPDEVIEYARALVAGVQAHQADIDALIVKYADRWALQRMPVVDRTVLRMALCELLWGEDIPVAVAINEAVELVKSLSTDDSGRFVNGVLGRIAEAESAPT